MRPKQHSRLAASFDHAGEQPKGSVALFGACALADLAGNHPVARGALGFIVGQWQKWVETPISDEDTADLDQLSPLAFEQLRTGS